MWVSWWRMEMYLLYILVYKPLHFHLSGLKGPCCMVWCHVIYHDRPTHIIVIATRSFSFIHETLRWEITQWVFPRRLKVNCTESSRERGVYLHEEPWATERTRTSHMTESLTGNPEKMQPSKNNVWKSARTAGEIIPRSPQGSWNNNNNRFRPIMFNFEVLWLFCFLPHLLLKDIFVLLKRVPPSFSNISSLQSDFKWTRAQVWLMCT